MIALSLCLFSFTCLLNRRFLKSFILYLPAIGFHSTAFIYFIIYPIFYLTNKHTVHTIRYCIALGIIIYGLIIPYTEDILIFLISWEIVPDSFVGYIIYTVQGQDFSSSDLIYYIIIFVSLQYARKKSYNTEQFILFRCIILTCIMLTPLAVLISSAAKRCTLYFSFLSIVFFPMVLYRNKKVCLSYTLLTIVIFFLFSFGYKTFIVDKVGNITYTSKILGIN
jgi:hypothetical protein